MKQTKQRVVAIDYFRGVCILMVIINHAAVFSMPFAYLAGDGGLWTSAAEMFFLLSGITLGIVRGDVVIENFRSILFKTWRRAISIYFINVLVSILSLLMALYILKPSVVQKVVGDIPTGSFIGNIGNILSLQYTYGLAAFLMFYSVFLIFAPFALRLSKSKLWILVPLLSTSIYILFNIFPNALPALKSYSVWQLYFFWGITIARFRPVIIGWYYDLSKVLRSAASAIIIGTSTIVLLTSILVDFNIYPTINRLTYEGWLPQKLRNAYLHLWNLRPDLFTLFRNERFGYLRPIATLLTFIAAYLIYQNYKESLLRHTGNFINKMGAQTLYVFVGQAFAIPLLANLPLPRNFVTNFILTTLLLGVMWMLANRTNIKTRTRLYINDLKSSYSQAKWSYLQRYEDY